MTQTHGPTDCAEQSHTMFGSSQWNVSTSSSEPPQPAIHLSRQPFPRQSRIEHSIVVIVGLLRPCADCYWIQTMSSSASGASQSTTYMPLYATMWWPEVLWSRCSTCNRDSTHSRHGQAHILREFYGVTELGFKYKCERCDSLANFSTGGVEIKLEGKRRDNKPPKKQV